MRKISFIYLLKEEGELSLAKAKDLKDRLTSGEVVEIQVSDIKTAKYILKKAKELGVIGELQLPP